MDNSLSLKAQHLSLVAGMMTWLSICSHLVKVASMIFLTSFVMIDAKTMPIVGVYLIGFYALWLTDGYLMANYVSYRSLYEDVSHSSLDETFSLNNSAYMRLRTFFLALAAKTIMPYYALLIMVACALTV